MIKKRNITINVSNASLPSKASLLISRRELDYRSLSQCQTNNHKTRERIHLLLFTWYESRDTKVASTDKQPTLTTGVVTVFLFIRFH